jgi:hypothetical protein
MEALERLKGAYGGITDFTDFTDFTDHAVLRRAFGSAAIERGSAIGSNGYRTANLRRVGR